MKTLATLRSEIDNIDMQLQNLIDRRMQLAKKISKCKDADVYQPEREAEILQKIVERNNGPLTDVALISIFQAIITASRSLQERLH